MSDFSGLLDQGLKANHIVLSETTQQQLVAFLELMQKWNKVFNLTAIDTPADMVTLHIIDSLVVSPYLHGDQIIDVGTGAGLPGIPLALMHPDKQFTLLDSNGKKTRFLTQVKGELGLSNVTVVQSRCEQFKSPTLFTSILSRAFSSIALMLVNTQHLLAKEGQFIAMKGVYPEEELTQILPPFYQVATHPLIIQGLPAKRHVVCIEMRIEDV